MIIEILIGFSLLFLYLALHSEKYTFNQTKYIIIFAFLLGGVIANILMTDTNGFCVGLIQCRTESEFLSFLIPLLLIGLLYESIKEEERKAYSSNYIFNSDGDNIPIYYVNTKNKDWLWIGRNNECTKETFEYSETIRVVDIDDKDNIIFEGSIFDKLCPIGYNEDGSIYQKTKQLEETGCSFNEYMFNLYKALHTPGTIELKCKYCHKITEVSGSNNFISLLSKINCYECEKKYEYHNKEFKCSQCDRTIVCNIDKPKLVEECENISLYKRCNKCCELNILQTNKETNELIIRELRKNINELGN